MNIPRLDWYIPQTIISLYYSSFSDLIWCCWNRTWLPRCMGTKGVLVIHMQETDSELPKETHIRFVASGCLRGGAGSVSTRCYVQYISSSRMGAHLSVCPTDGYISLSKRSPHQCVRKMVHQLVYVWLIACFCHTLVQVPLTSGTCTGHLSKMIIPVWQIKFFVIGFLGSAQCRCRSETRLWGLVTARLHCQGYARLHSITNSTLLTYNILPSLS